MSNHDFHARMHELKCWPYFFRQLQDGIKTFELRKNDRAFKQGDTLVLREWNPGIEDYTGSPPLEFVVTHILYGPIFGLEPGWCIMSIKRSTDAPGSLG